MKHASKEQRFKDLVLGITVLGLLAILVLVLMDGHYLLALLFALLLWVVIDGIRRELRRRAADPRR